MIIIIILFAMSLAVCFLFLSCNFYFFCWLVLLVLFFLFMRLSSLIGVSHAILMNMELECISKRLTIYTLSDYVQFFFLFCWAINTYLVYCKYYLLTTVMHETHRNRRHSSFPLISKHCSYVGLSTHHQLIK